MVNLEELAKARKNEGYSDINAEARVCQDTRKETGFTIASKHTFSMILK